MSGFTRDPHHYGERLVYEALLSKWGRYHDRCGCGNNWITHHAEPAGFTAVRQSSGFVALTGPGLTEDVDEARLTTNALWKAVTGQDGTQDWFEQVKVIDRSEQAPPRRRSGGGATAKTRAAEAPITEAQLRYVTKLVTTVSADRFNEEFAAAITGTTIAPRGAQEKAMQAVKRLPKTAARKLISGLLT